MIVLRARPTVVDMLNVVATAGGDVQVGMYLRVHSVPVLVASAPCGKQTVIFAPS